MGSCNVVASARDRFVSEVGGRRACEMPPQPALPWHPAFVLSKDKSDGFLLGAGNSALRAGKDLGSSELLVTAGRVGKV